MAWNISNRGDDPEAIPDISRGSHDVTNFAPVTPEDEYGTTVTLSLDPGAPEPLVTVTPSDDYSKKAWAKLCAHRRGNGIGGV